MVTRKIEAFGPILLRHLEASRQAGKPLPSFSGICRALGIPARQMENILYEELGVSGEEVVAAYRN